MSEATLAQICLKHQALLLREENDTLYIAVTDVPDPALLNTLRFTANKKIDVSCWTTERLEKARQEDFATPTMISSDSVAEQVDALLSTALQRRASDIHFEPGADGFTVRLRIDGVLHPLPVLPLASAAPYTARLKIAADLDIAERRLPQDGQFTTHLNNQPVSFRVSTLPCRFGEKTVLRLQEQHSRPLSIDALGMEPEALREWKDALCSPQGLILVTGPTGSGKTLTLYSGLNALNQPDVNICSVEDPIEIPLAGINQTQINTKAGLDFHNILRALLRQDPDVIMIGEIRDAKTADIAVKAAQTGHLVMSTLHTNSTTETLTRLQQMGIPGWMVASALRLIIAQRLVRKLCPYCRKKMTDNADESWQPTGCERCYSGYYGRLALFEVLPVKGAIRQAIINNESAENLSRIAEQQGFISLVHSGNRAIKAGETTQSEIWRVLGFDGDNDNG